MVDEMSAYTFQMWWRALDSAEWVPGHGLLVHVNDGENVVLGELSWGTANGAQSAVGFSPDMTSCYGHRRTTNGDVLEVRGELQGQPGDSLGTGDARGYEFDTEIEDTAGWHPSEPLRLLIDDGADAPLLWTAWRDRAGNSCSVVLRSVSPTGNADVTGMVTHVWASAEYRDAGEVAANLVEGTHSKWFAPHDRASLEFQFPQPIVADRYVVTSANDAPDRDPAAWTLRGSVGGNRWRVLDTRTHQSFTDRHESRTYPIADPGAYACYRLDIVGNNGSPHLQLETVQFLAAVSGFTGYRQRAGHTPTAYRGSSAVPEAPDTPMEPLPEELPSRHTRRLSQFPGTRILMHSGDSPSAPPVGDDLIAGGHRLPTTPDVPVIRTDFSDQVAWERVKAGISWVTPDEFEANVTYIDDPAFAGLTPTDLLASGPDRATHALMLVVDETTIHSPEHPILVVDLRSEPDPVDDWRGEPAGRSFRAVPHTIQEIENNLTISNMDWEEFADGVDDDGVRREHMLYGRVEDLTVDQATE
jgi:hypothetical protein